MCKNETFGDASPFQESSLEKPQDKIHALCKELEECGYNYNGTETMMCGWNGKNLEQKSSLDQYITTD